MIHWFKNAVFYSLDVDTYCDSNADGVGDFKGLIEKLDYLSGLGVTCLWLLPFYPSPNRDNGYDVKDYYNVDSRLGDLGDFVRFTSRCKALGIKVVIDLVINHTSIEHPWFKEARKDKESPYRDFYIWSDSAQPFKKSDVLLHGEEHTIWTYDDKAGQFYLHKFYKEQPDLNLSCRLLREEILKIMEFWLTMRVDGFRIDASEMVIETYGIKGASRAFMEKFLEEMRSFVASKNPDAILLAEANIHPQKVPTYFKQDRRMHMMFNFFINQRLFLALATKKVNTLVSAFESLPVCSGDQQWLNFLRHHDELSLQLLSGKQMDKVLTQFAPKKEMRIFDKGIRRRLAPMVDNDPRMLQMLYSLLFSLPGAVLIRYGDEIGMGEDLSLQGRSSVRTPMQWSTAANGGFSNAGTESLVHPMVTGDLGFEVVNVMSQQREPSSLLNFIERLITTRKQVPEIGSGSYKFIKGISDSIIFHTCETGGNTVLFIHNFTDETFTIPAIEIFRKKEVFEVFSDNESFIDNELLVLRAFGFIWLRIGIEN